MERGHSTVEVAIVFPVALAILWWSITAPLVGVRALAARSAALAGARLAAVEDRPEAGWTGQTVEECWKRLGGRGSGKKVEVSLSSRSVALKVQETGSVTGRMKDFWLELGREKD